MLPTIKKKMKRNLREWEKVDFERKKKRRKTKLIYNIDKEIVKLRQLRKKLIRNVDKLIKLQRSLIKYAGINWKLCSLANVRSEKRKYGKHSNEYIRAKTLRASELEKFKKFKETNTEFKEGRLKEFELQCKLGSLDFDIKVLIKKRRKFKNDIDDVRKTTAIKDIKERIDPIYRKNNIYPVDYNQSKPFDSSVNITYKYYIEKKLFSNAGLLDHDINYLEKELKRVLVGFKFDCKNRNIPIIKLRRKFTYLFCAKDFYKNDYALIMIIGLNPEELDEALYELKIYIEGELILEANKKRSQFHGFEDCIIKTLLP